MSDAASPSAQPPQPGPRDNAVPTRHRRAVNSLTWSQFDPTRPVHENLRICKRYAPAGRKSLPHSRVSRVATPYTDTSQFQLIQLQLGCLKMG